MNERDYPHIIELQLPPGGLRDRTQEIVAFHEERRLPMRQGRARPCGCHAAEQGHVAAFHAITKYCTLDSIISLAK